MRLKKIFFYIGLLSLILLTGFAHAKAQSSIGIGVSEQSVKSNGIFSNLLLYIAFWQHKFERLLSGWLVGIKTSPENALKLILASFAYGILHALGPGHGKAVISSYLLAGNESLKRGISLSFYSSLLQAMSAIILVALVFFFLPARLTQASEWMTKASYALIMLLGLSLLIRKTPQLLRKIYNGLSFKSKYHHINKPMSQTINKLFDKPKISFVLDGQENTNPKHDIDTNSRYCEVCNTTHIFSADFVSKPLKLRTAVGAVFSVGIRPCTGAIFVMSFAFLNSLYYIGAASVLAMSLGTFITVSALAILAVKARDIAMKFMHKSNLSLIFLYIVEWIFAFIIFFIGLVFWGAPS